MKESGLIRWYDIIDSTNSQARRCLDEIDNMAVFAAAYQTAGRGQRGNRWSSARGENLTFSILLKGAAAGGIGAGEQFRLSEVAALATYDFILSEGVECRIKWPNDIYFRDRKICGILIENILEGDAVAASIIGIGINLNQTEFPPELLNPVSLKMLTGVHRQPETALEKFMEHFTLRLQDIGDSEALKAAYESVMYRKNSEYQFRDLRTEEIFRGTIKGVSPCGKLVVRMPDGESEEFTFKEIGYII